MNARTFASLLVRGRLTTLLKVAGAARDYHRIAFLGGALASGLLRRLASGPVSFETLIAERQVDPAMRDALRAWLDLGVALGELRAEPRGYRLRGSLSRALAKPEHDPAAAFVEELTFLHNTLIGQTPDRLSSPTQLTLADQDARMIARSSRLAEPLIAEALDHVLPRRGPLRLLEIGCGSAAYIRHAARRNPRLTALGLELQAEAAALARENIARWGLSERVAIEIGDIRRRDPDSTFDLATLHQNIYYFPVGERVETLRHVRRFLRPGGRLLVTTVCQGRGSTAAVLNLWAAATEGCGRLPTPDELVAQLGAAGFDGVAAKCLMPRESFFAFIAVNPGASHPGEPAC
jgi:SAM-dependent methyltransferase